MNGRLTCFQASPAEAGNGHFYVMRATVQETCVTYFFGRLVAENDSDFQEGFWGCAEWGLRLLELAYPP